MIKKTVFAGGCFWGLQELIRKQEGVVKTIVGYAGGTIKNPSYENHIGYSEAVEISYETELISYEELLDFFFRIHNPTTLNRQGNDLGISYRSVVFYSEEAEKKLVEKFIKIVNDSNRWSSPVVTAVEKLDMFYPAESSHQDYLQKNPNGYTCHRVYFSSYLE